MNVNTINLSGVNFPIEDTTARAAATAAQNAANNALSQANAGGDPSTLGANAQTQFAAEINAAPFSGNVWAWIQARIKAGNFDGLAIGDFIPFTADGNNYKAEIAGINTYKRYGDVEVGNHIDFITRDCHPTAFLWNRANYNNGTTVSSYPWLASDIYARLNSLQMNVPNATTHTPALVSADYRTVGGILNTLPTALQNVIVTKRVLLPMRYTAGALLIDDNSWGWVDAGKLWLPSEMEVYGTNAWGTLNPANPGWSVGGFQQYPIFAHNMRRVKGAGDGGARSAWWLLSTRGGLSTIVAIVGNGGYASNANATSTAIRVPLCFRIA